MSAYTGSVPDTLYTDEWAEQARCRTCDPELWFSLTATGQRMARSLCLICPVRLECLSAYMSKELGVPEAYRFGVFGGLTPSERKEADPSGSRLKRDSDLADAAAPCGTYGRLLHHLVLKEPVDLVCWVGEVARVFARTAAADGLPAAVLARPAVQNGGARASAVDQDVSRPAPPPAAAAPVVPAVIAGLVWQPGRPSTSPPAPRQRRASADPFTGPRPRQRVPDCGTQEAYDRHVEQDEAIDPTCWNTIGRHIGNGTTGRPS